MSSKHGNEMPLAEYDPERKMLIIPAWEGEPAVIIIEDLEDNDE